MAKNNIKILSDLESEIMEIVWKAGNASVRDVLLEMQKKRKIAYTTVMTVMSRLYDKGVLERKLNASGAFVYESMKEKEAFIQEKSQKIIKGFLREYGDVAVAQFFDIIESSDSRKSKEWKSKLKKLIE
ncbi:MAG: BlaI/MecI/CopY family transcriptional regulator [Candidatus Paceibacterota bacterium]|jgi:predicted transcriptional regulator